MKKPISTNAPVARTGSRVFLPLDAHAADISRSILPARQTNWTTNFLPAQSLEAALEEFPPLLQTAPSTRRWSRAQAMQRHSNQNHRVDDHENRRHVRAGDHACLSSAARHRALLHVVKQNHCRVLLPPGERSRFLRFPTVQYLRQSRFLPQFL